MRRCCYLQKNSDVLKSCLLTSTIDEDRVELVFNENPSNNTDTIIINCPKQRMSIKRNLHSIFIFFLLERKVVTVTKTVVTFSLPLTCSVESNSFNIDKVHTFGWNIPEMSGNTIEISQFTLEDISDNFLLMVSNEGTQTVIKSLQNRKEEIERLKEQEQKHEIHESQVNTLSYWNYSHFGVTGVMGAILFIVGIFFCVRHC